MRPTIGITSGMVVNKLYPNSPAVMGQQFTYVDAIVRAGGVPLIIPLLENQKVLKQIYKQCDALLIAGGNDITPSLYGAKPSSHSASTHLKRDQQELSLWRWSKNDDLPVLGVCRGMQFINVANGGTLYQDIPTDLPNSEVHRVSPEKSHEGDYLMILHQLKIKPDSKLAKILETTDVGANAFHHQAVKKLGEGLEATAWAQDGVIEALEMPSRRFVVAVQSHPEALEDKVLPIWRKLFKALVVAAEG